MTTINVSTAAQLQSALASAQGGDVIVLADGYYGDVSIDENFSSYVTIRAATPLGATFDSITINNSSYLKLDGVHVDSPDNSGNTLLGISYSDHIMVVDSEVNGKVDTVYPIAGPQFGIRVENSSYVTVDDNNVHDVVNGVAFFGSDHLTLTGNNVDYIGADAFKFGNIDTALIENNTGPSYLYPDDDAHSDFMQFQGDSSSNLTIRGNVFLPQNHFGTQGIFIAGDGGHSNILIEQNIIHTKMANGIYVAGNSTGVTIRDNTLIAADGDVTRIAAPDDASVSGNITSGRNGARNGSNLTLQGGDAGAAYFIGDLFPHWVLGQGLTLQALRPRAGSEAATTGAAERLRALLAP